MIVSFHTVDRQSIRLDFYLKNVKIFVKKHELDKSTVAKYFRISKKSLFKKQSRFQQGLQNA